MKKDKSEKVVEFEPVKLQGEIEITPEKDFHIVQNEIDIYLKTGEPVTVPRKFLQNLVTEKVIDKLPK